MPGWGPKNGAPLPVHGCSARDKQPSACLQQTWILLHPKEVNISCLLPPLSATSWAWSPPYGKRQMSSGALHPPRVEASTLQLLHCSGFVWSPTCIVIDMEVKVPNSPLWSNRGRTCLPPQSGRRHWFCYQRYHFTIGNCHNCLFFLSRLGALHFQ